MKEKLMVKIVDKQNVFNKGIMTSKLRARDDLQQYTQGVADAKNFIISKYGPLTKRVGTKFIADLGNVGEEAALIPFVFSVDKSILLEFTSDKIRFYTFDGDNFGQSRIYKLTTDDESAEYEYLYITDDPIKSWASQDDKEKATKVFADSSCSELVGYVRSEATKDIRVDKKLIIRGEDIYNSFYREVWIDNENMLLYFYHVSTGENDTDKIKSVVLPDKVSHIACWPNNNILVMLGNNNKVYNITVPYYYDINPVITTITTKTAPAISKITELIPAGFVEDNYVVGFDSVNNKLYVTSDGGITWKTKTLPTKHDMPGYDQKPYIKYFRDSYDLAFIDEYGEGYIIDFDSLKNTTLTSSSLSVFKSTYGYRRFKILYIDSAVHTSTSSARGMCVYDTETDITYFGKFKTYNLTPQELENLCYQQVIGEVLNTDLFFYAYVDKKKAADDVLNDKDNIYTLYNETTNRMDIYVGNNLVDDTVNWLSPVRGTPFYFTSKDSILSFTHIRDDEDIYHIDNYKLTDKIFNDQIYISKSTESPNSTDKELFANTYTKSDEVVYYEKELDEEINNENLGTLSYAQSLDVLYLAFPDGKTSPKELRRRSDVDWELVDFQPEDGPYGEVNYDTSKTLKLSTHAIGEATVTSSFDLFSESDIGRHIRLNMATYNKDTLAYEDHWTWGEITSFTNATTVKANMKVDNSKVKDNDTTISSSTTTWEWRLGAWTEQTGYPTKVTVHEQRLAWAGITDRPWVWLSNSFAYKFYAPSEYDGTITDSNAISHDLSTDKISRIHWMKSVKNLIIGTEFEELRMLSSGPALAPSDVAVLREASYGSFNTEPVITEDVIIFIQRLQRSLRALSYDYYRDAFLGPNLALLSEDLTLGGIKRIVYQKEPYSVLWVLKDDGKLLTCTYDKEQEVVGWTECELAGDARVVDLMVFPSNNIKQDSVAFIVERTINGQKRRYLELLTREYLHNVDLSEVTFMDSSIRYQGSSTNRIAGLKHLEGETVMVVENGMIIGEFPVKKDTITNDDDEIISEEYYIELDTNVSDVWIGLPYDAYFRTLERDFNDKQLSTHNSKIRIYKLYLTLIRTLGLTVQQLDDGEEFNLITFDPHLDLDKSPEPVSGREELDTLSTWTNDIMHYSMQINSVKGLPCTVAGITTGIEINAL